MVEAIEDMPEGTIGYRATGHVTREDYREVLEPAMRAAAEVGEVRMVYAIGPGFEKFEPGALAEDAKTGVSLGFSHPHAWKRVAVVTDVEWIVKAMHGFGWMAPGEVKTYAVEQLEEAKRWVAA